MADDLFWEFLEYDFVMGADMVKCPHCGADVPCSLFFDDKVECPKCGKEFAKEPK
jgi:endogenous inhibitor of DNA gyrase (YacG/DUF329 family)